VAFATATGATLLVGDDGGASEYKGGRASLLWKPIEALSATLVYVNQQLDQDGFAEENLVLGGYKDSPLSLGTHTPGGRELRYSDTELFNLTLEWGLQNFDLVSSTSRFNSEGGEARDIFRGNTFPWGVTDDSFSRLTTQELRVSSKFDGMFNFLSGIYYEDQDEDLNEIAFGIGANSGTVYDLHLKDAVRQKAFFSELYVDLTQQLKLTLGGRHFDYERTNSTVVVIPAVPGNRLSASTDGLTLKANLSYEPGDNSLVYVQWAEGFRLGRPLAPPRTNACDQDIDGILDGTSSTPFFVRQLDPDTVATWELGGKFALMDSRLILNAAAYRTDWKKLPGLVFNSPDCSAVRNASEARVEGAEIEGALGLTRSLAINLSASVTDAKLVGNAAALSAEAGDPVPNVAGFQGTVGFEYRYQVLGLPGFWRADYAYIDSYHGDFAETSAEFGNYGKVDTRAGLSFGRYEVSLYGTNLTGEDALTAGDPFGRVWRLRPRTYGLEFRATWE
jgi:outer membrane receptor protein involved in Fe transport